MADWDARRKQDTWIPFTAMDLFRLANEIIAIDKPNIRAALIYECSCTKTSDLLNGVQKTDGTIVRLSTADIDLCLGMRLHFIGYWINMRNTLFDVDPGSLCPTCMMHKGNCRRAADIVQKQLVTDSSKTFDAHPERAWNILNTDFWTSWDVEASCESNRMCRECIKFYKAIFGRKFRKDLVRRTLEGFLSRVW